MALFRSALQVLDPLTFNAVVETQLEDTLAPSSSAKGKQRLGTVTDAQLALQMYSEDLRACQTTLTDRNMAQSVALAIFRDGQIIGQVHQQEDQMARDRNLALSLQEEGSDMVVDHTQNADSGKAAANDPWKDEELLAKAAALYNDYEDDSLTFNPSLVQCEQVHCADEESQNAPRAESATWAASRCTNQKQKLGICIACGDTKDFFDVARVPCNHGYCRDCLASSFRASIRDESLFPPSCD